MELRNVSSEWYEAVMIGGYGCKLYGTYNSKAETEIAVKEANNRAVERGYKADKYFIMRCSCVRLIEDNGDVVSETTTRTRV